MYATLRNCFLGIVLLVWVWVWFVRMRPPSQAMTVEYCYNPSKLLGGYRYRPLAGRGGVKRSGTMHPKSLSSRPVFGEKRADVKGICVCGPPIPSHPDGDRYDSSKLFGGDRCQQWGAECSVKMPGIIMHSKVSFPEPVHSRGLILRTDPHPNNLKASSQKVSPNLPYQRINPFI